MGISKKWKTTLPAKKLQLAIQGGGAKLSALLAAAEAFQEAQDEGLIEITQIAGTSAGAIVAAFLSAGIKISDVRDDLRKVWGAKFIDHYGKFPNLINGTQKVLRETLQNLSAPRLM